MREVLRRAGPVAASEAPVVILGETGTGKEVLARALHASSPRAGRAFVAVNCGAMPAELIESEFFGHARGAFSGAVAEKRGLFEEAAGGTILLDEIAELPLPMQVKLLRVLQDGEVRRVGANRSAAVDVRVIAATHRDLGFLVKAGTFREDLYYRLKVFTFRLPPLRERIEDILPLARDILVHQPGNAERFSPDAERALLDHDWPGNIRELVNAMRYAAAMTRGGCVDREDLPDELQRRVPWLPDPSRSSARRRRSRAARRRRAAPHPLGAGRLRGEPGRGRPGPRHRAEHSLAKARGLPSQPGDSPRRRAPTGARFPRHALEAHPEARSLSQPGAAPPLRDRDGGARVHLPLSPHRAARLRHHQDPLRPGPALRRAEEPQALPLELPERGRLPRARDQRDSATTSSAP